jgi:ribosomal-protein-alanine N-acetyltransferase
MAAIHRAAMPPDRPWSADEITSILNTHGAFFVAVPSGFAIGRAIADEAELLTLCVAPGHRRMGLGRRLLAAFGAEAGLRGANTAYLEVAADNAAAIGLYEGNGWVQSGRRNAYYARDTGAHVDALIFHKALVRG